MSKIDLVKNAIDASAARKGRTSWLTIAQARESESRLADLCDGRELSSESDPPKPFHEYWGTTDDGGAWRVIVTL